MTKGKLFSVLAGAILGLFITGIVFPPVMPLLICFIKIVCFSGILLIIYPVAQLAKLFDE
mgnify:CR=1 FL=1